MSLSLSRYVPSTPSLSRVLSLSGLRSVITARILFSGGARKPPQQPSTIAIAPGIATAAESPLRQNRNCDHMTKVSRHCNHLKKWQWLARAINSMKGCLGDRRTGLAYPWSERVGRTDIPCPKCRARSSLQSEPRLRPIVSRRLHGNSALSSPLIILHVCEGPTPVRLP